MDETIETLKNEVERLRAQVAQLKLDLGHRRSDGYAVAELRRETDRLVADVVQRPSEYGLSELVTLQRLRDIAHGAGAFGKEEK